jgi:hypothetical protein
MTALQIGDQCDPMTAIWTLKKPKKAQNNPKKPKKHREIAKKHRQSERE